MTALDPPVRVALARDARTVPGPDGSWAFEAKFDGWRAVLFTAAGLVQSRAGKDLSARFPEIARAGHLVADAVLDGELVALRDGRLDFVALQSSASTRRAGGVGIYFVVFDVLAADGRDLRSSPYRERRRRLELLPGIAAPLQLAPMTTDRNTALAWMRPEYGQAGIEGVVSKQLDAPYRAGRSDAWIKTRQKVLTDALVLGVTGTIGHPDSLVLGQTGPDGVLRAVGLSLPLTGPQRAALAGRLHPIHDQRELPGLIGGLPGTPDFSYQPVTPSMVVEVEADPLVEFDRFRHRPRVHRVR